MTSFRQILGASPSKASPSDSTLVIIDAQNEYAEGLLRVDAVESSRRAMAALLEAYRKHGTGHNILHVVHDASAAAPVFTGGTTLAEEFSELAAEAGEPIVRKTQPGAFTGTDLDQQIAASGHNKVVLVGYQAHLCISSTARQAAERGLDVVVVEDAMGDRNIPGASAAELKRLVLAEIADGFGTVVQSADVLA